MTEPRTISIVALCTGLVLGACVGGEGPAIVAPAAAVTDDPVIYVAIGASETSGVGTDDPFTEAWPKVLWRESLPEAVLYDLGRPGSTLAEALVEQAPQASALEPDVVTVWLNVNDMVRQIPVALFEQDLRRMLEPLTQTGASVLVATTPRIDSLPIYLACRPDPPADGPSCPAPDVSLPTPTEVRAIVTGYNAATERVAAETGAIVVDLQAYGNAPATNPGWIAPDGFHPSTEGARAIAQAFAEVLPPEVVEAASAPR